jgi:hypothetical protein
MATPRLHRVLDREDDAPRLAGLLASAAPTPSRLRSGFDVEVIQAVTAARLPRIHTGFPFAERTLFHFLTLTGWCRYVSTVGFYW